MTRFVRTCVRCSGEVIEREMDELVREANSVVMVTVHAGVCRKCGEAYFAPESVELFEKIRRKLAAGDVSSFTPVGQAYRA